LNKKFVLIVFVLLVGAVFLSACQREEIGANVGLNKAGTKADTGGSGSKFNKIYWTCDGKTDLTLSGGTNCDDVDAANKKISDGCTIAATTCVGT